MTPKRAIRAAFAVAALLTIFSASSAFAQTQIYVNEFYRAGNLGTTDEWVELVLQVPLTAAQLDGFFVGDSTGTTTAKFSGYKFTNMASIAANFPAGTIIVIAGTTGPAADLTYNPAGGDWNITLKTAGANLTSNGSTGDFAATDVVYVDTNGTNGNATLSAAGFAVNWHATPGAFGAVASVTITAPANNTGAVLTSGLNTATTPANWTTSVALGSMTPGQPNGGANTTYINGLRAPTISISDGSVIEGNAGTVNLSFNVNLTAVAPGNVTFDFSTSDIVGQATGGVDYVTQTNQPYTITAGNLSTTVNVVVNGDLAIEPNETFNATIANIVGAAAGDTAAIGTILNDDSPTLNIDDVSQIEGEVGTTSFVFTVSLTQPAGPGGVQFEVATANGPAPTATAGTDYVAIPAATPGSIAFNASSTTVTVTVNGDTDFEPSEKFFVNISNIVGATPGDVQGLGTILTDDIGLSIDNVTQNELNGGTSVFTFTVSLTSPAEGPGVTFDIATQDGSTDPATAGSDYVAKSELTRTIAAGASSAQFTVTVNGDTAIEANETFFVNVTNVTGAEVTDGQGLGTITNDDFPSFSIADAVITEGNAGTQLLTFTVTLTPAAGGPTSVDYATADDSATAISGDFVGISPTTLPFGTGETTKQFTVTINGDLAPEGDEQFFVNLTNPSGGAAIGDGQAFGIIHMDDPRGIPGVDVPVTENFDALVSTNVTAGTPGATTPVGWTFRETGSNANDLYLADDGNSNSGNTYSFGTDGSSDRAFGGVQSGTVTVLPTIGAFYRNDTGQTITTLTINYFGEEWRFGATGRADRLDFQYSLDATSLTTGTWTDFDNLDFITPDTAGPVGAKNGNAAQFRAAVSGSITGLSIPAGATFWIRFNDFNASGADDGLAVDDLAIVANISNGLTINDVNIIEGNAGTSILQFTVTRSQPSGTPTTFNITTADNTATDADNDYEINSVVGATIPGDNTTTTYTFNVTINGDTNQEPTENFFVNISNVTNATLLDGQGIGTILADDFTLTLISAVQGSGNTSPIAGSTVTVAGIVTGIKQGGSGGFFVQEELADEDGNPNTSEGIFVFTAGAIPAGVVIGNRVAVTGTVQEFPASAAPHTVTELSGAISVSLLAVGQPLPAPFTLTATQGAPTTNLSQYEPWEGMRVATTLEVTAPTGGNIDETNATGSSDGVFYGVILGVAKAFREPGIPVMDVVPSEAACPACIPRFDRNPERIRVSSTSQPGATQLNVAVGQQVSNLVGPLDYGFFEYSLLPEAATVPSVSGSSTYVAVPTPLSSELTVSSINLERFYDTVEDPLVGDVVLTATAFNNRLNKASLAIRDVLMTPDVVGVVEIENLTTLQALATKINADTNGATNYFAYLEEGNDQGGIDVGFLVNLNRVSVTAVTQFGLNTTFVDPSDSSVDILNDRPPLMLEGTIQRTDATTYAFTVIINHLRSLNGNEENSNTGLRVREKRRLQAEFLANFIQGRQTTNPGERIILVGDFNAFQFNDGMVDTVNTIKGTPPPANEVVEPSSDLVNPNFTNLVDGITAGQRYSYEFGGNLQVLDHAIVSAAMLSTNTRTAYGHFDAGFPEVFRSDANRPERVSDHDGIVAYFDLSPVGVLDFTAANYDVAESTTTFNVTVSRTGGDTGAVSVSYTIAAGTATAGSDFTAGSGTITFADGETSKTFPVTIANDLIDEANQTINLSLSNPTGDALIGIQGTATITILDDDAAPVFTINDNPTAVEGDSGSTNAQLTVTLTGATELETSVTWATAPDSATAGSDYTTSGGTVNFSAGAGPQTQTINVPILGDTLDEVNERLFVNLSSPSNATIGDSQGEIIIVDDEGAPQLIINDLSFNEGNSGTTQYSLTVTLVGSTSQQVEVSWTLDPGTASCCGVDFSGPHGTMTFPVGVTTRTISATIFGETLYEPDETILVNLYNPVNATIGDNQGVFTIVNDDQPPVFTISDVTVTEGDSGSANAQLTVTLTGGTAFPSSVNWATAPDTATAGSDYSTSGGTLNFPAGNGPQSQTINIPILGDLVDESNERLFVNLSVPSNATIGDSQGEITITDNEGAPQFTISDVTVTEGDSGSANAQLTVTLTGSTSFASSVNWATANDTATAGSDYTTSGGTLNFPAGAGPQTQTINVPILGDTIAEATERLFVNLSGATNATIGDSQGQITINDNEGAPTITISDLSVSEGNSGTAQYNLVITLTGSTSQTVSVSWTLDPGTASCCGVDFSGPNGTVSFPPGVTTRNVGITVFGDNVTEPDETVLVNLYNAVNATIADNQGVLTILNDDPDADGDGVSDVLDNCPATPNPTQTDTDNDGVGDACENDTDGDGVADGIEQAAPNGGDGNGDGIADYLQGSVASIPAANGNGYLTLRSSCTLLQVSVTTESNMPVSDPSFNYPVELIAFRAPCSSATFSLYVYGSGAASAYRKFGPNPPGGPNQWYTLPGATFTTATVGTLHPRRIDFSLTDGGVGDDTPVDGVIVDQGGPGGGNDIPTLSWEMLVALAALLAVAAAVKMRA